MSQWTKSQPILLNGGLRLDLAGAPERIPLGSFLELVNLHHAEDRYLRKRRGFDRWESGLTPATFAYGVFSLYKSTGERYRIVLDTSSDVLRLHYKTVGGAWGNIATFFATGYQRVRGTRLRGDLYLTNGADNLRFFHTGSVYGDAGVWPPTSQPSTTFGADPTTDATDDDDLDIADSGFLQYCVTFLYKDPVTGVAIHESPASARTLLANAHWGDINETYNMRFGYIRRGLSLTLPTRTDLDASIQDRVDRRRIYRRWKAYADQPWGDWAMAQEIHSGTSASWVDSIDAASGAMTPDNDVPPIGTYLATTENRLFLANLQDRLPRQPSLPDDWAGCGGGYTPAWPYRARISISDPNGKVVTRGMVEMKFTNDVAHIASRDPDPAGDGAYLPGMAGLTLSDVETMFCFTADDGLTEIGYYLISTNATDIVFLVEIPQLLGTETVYIYYGDVGAFPIVFGPTRWEGVFHKLYAQTDMILLCNLDEEVSFESYVDVGIDRIQGRIGLIQNGAAWVGTDGGYVDDSVLNIFSTGKCVEFTAHNHFFLLNGNTNATQQTTTADHGTLQMHVWVDFSELQGAAAENLVFQLHDATTAAMELQGTIREDAGTPGAWYFQLIDGASADLLTDNGGLGIALAELISDMWMFISVAWGTNTTSLAYIDSVLFSGAGPVSSINYDSSALNIGPWRAVYLGASANSIIGKVDELVIYDHERNDTDQVNADFLRRTYWENDLLMETGEEEDLFTRTDRPARITWSNNSAPDIFQVDNFRESDTGAEVTGMVAFGGNILVFYMNELRILNTSMPSTQALFTAIDDVTQMWALSDDKTGEMHGLGCVAPDSVQAAEHFVLFYGMRGLYAFAPGGFYHVSKALDTTLDEIPLPFRRAIQGQIYPKDHQYWMAVPSGDSTAYDQNQISHDRAQPFGKAPANEVKSGQSFTPHQPLLSGVEFYRGASTGTFIGTVTISIYEDDPDDPGHPSDVRVVSHTYEKTGDLWESIATDAATLCALPAYLEPEQTYHIVFEASTSDNANHPNIRAYDGVGIADMYEDGILQEYNGTAWADGTADEDLYFRTVYAYHDTVYVLDLKSVGADPDRVRWTEYRWGATDYFNARGFALLDDVGDQGELLVLDSALARIWEYDNGAFYDDISSAPIATIAQTGRLEYHDHSLRSVMTGYQLLDSDGDHTPELNLYVPDADDPDAMIVNVMDGADELFPSGTRSDDLRLDWREATLYDLRLKEALVELRAYPKKRGTELGGENYQMLAIPSLICSLIHYHDPTQPTKPIVAAGAAHSGDALAAAHDATPVYVRFLRMRFYKTLGHDTLRYHWLIFDDTNSTNAFTQIIVDPDGAAITIQDTVGIASQWTWYALTNTADISALPAGWYVMDLYLKNADPGETAYVGFIQMWTLP